MGTFEPLMEDKSQKSCRNTCALYWDRLVSVQVGPTGLAPHVTPSRRDPLPHHPGDEVTIGFCITKKKKIKQDQDIFKAESTKNPDIIYIQAILHPCLSMRQPLGSLHRGEYVSEQCS